MGPARWLRALGSWGAALGFLLALLPALALAPATGAAAADNPGATLSRQQAGKGGDITVKGTGWRPDALLMMLICGQATPARGVIGGTNACANADGRAVTTDSRGGFSKKLPVAEPPRPCPCVVHIATVTGEQAAADVVFEVAGHPVAALPKPPPGGRLAVLTGARLEGSSGVLTWFGAPPARTIVFTVGNLGSTPVKDPLFSLGTSHGVFAPQWEDRQWHGTVAPGKKARIRLDAELSAGAHGDYQVAVKYAGKVLVEQPWGVGRPWGVTFFWLLLCVVVPAAVFRIGMAVVDKAGPRAARAAGRSWRRRNARPGPAPRMPAFRRPGRADAPPQPSTATALPWFTPDTAPSENHPVEKHPTTKGNS
ncbi:hypothetical protein [Streptomyces sp. NBC_00388]|uniref:hypothetical protein n=1 Tax=Streptomyces sp. NBC_00388 TaxID=2975735 RepID=UPI002E1BD65C